MIVDCPRCRVRSVQTTAISRQPVFPRPNAEEWALERCQNPSRQGLILVSALPGRNEPQGVHPAASHDLDPTWPLAEELRRDFREAGACLDAGCFRASLVMSRRALQRCLREQGFSMTNAKPPKPSDEH